MIIFIIFIILMILSILMVLIYIIVIMMGRLVYIWIIIGRIRIRINDERINITRLTDGVIFGDSIDIFFILIKNMLFPFLTVLFAYHKL